MGVEYGKIQECQRKIGKIVEQLTGRKPPAGDPMNTRVLIPLLTRKYGLRPDDVGKLSYDQLWMYVQDLQRPKDQGGGSDDPGQLTPEARAILFIQERIKTTGKLPLKKDIAAALTVTPRAMRNWKAFKVAYAKLKRQYNAPPKGTKSKDGTLEAWRENGK